MLITALREDRESLYQQGIQQGEWNTKINMARVLLAEGLDISMILKATQLPLEEIERLQQYPDTH